MNSSEDSKLFVNPEGLDRVDELRIWYEELTTRPDKIDFHALSGTLNVETHGAGKDGESTQGHLHGEVNIKDFLRRVTAEKENPEEKIRQEDNGTKQILLE